MPGVIADDRFSGVESRGAMVNGLKQSYPLYQQLGLGSVTYELLEDKPLTGGLILVHVRWDFLDTHGDLLIDGTAYSCSETSRRVSAQHCVSRSTASKSCQPRPPLAASTSRPRPIDRQLGPALDCEEQRVASNTFQAPP
jgi:hypothetical protein